MNPESSFNKEIRRFLTEQPESTSAKTIQLIERSQPSFESYYALFDNFSYKLGIGIVVDTCIDDRTNKIIGYIPGIKYYPNNKVNEESHVDRLIDPTSPITLNQSYNLLARQLLYRIQRILNLEELVLN